MQELVGRLSALDPTSGDELKVIGYFDALIAGAAGTEALLKGAAVLSGTVAGACWPGGALRMSPEGVRLPAGEAGGWPSRPAADGRVWLERTGPAHANDAMVLERCALGVSIVRGRHRERSLGPLGVLLDGERTPQERTAAAARAGLGPRVRALAVTADRHLPGASAVLAGTDGPVRLAVLHPRDAAPAEGPVGLGPWGEPAQLVRSASAARLALQVSRATGAPVDAEELGGLLEAAAALAQRTPPAPDVAVLDTLDERSLRILDVLVGSESLRAAAAALGMHHSSLAARRTALAEALGYDPWTARGRARCQLARLAQQLGRPG
ncbi:hypothetical protein H9L10_13960 [Phycicoccus endophyticus]|uniref:Helix-turn-helix domain-containing protein n=1 Tax=Phycicoccus endophyticus TaxID=1690220 RepID=A0A7G9R117_9MICO|nr:hypothetical protein [Phycicoccus endophyticus]NHI20580.1 hypothetical protein [Phycicoccus endophyticus]QNN49292.1 hypothetical protein H9L10_13960 [Phycicoccus endophyticus]GGL44948.1 hypothetical protein GCM10012283_29400 [Phycicoccus endophyticus]